MAQTETIAVLAFLGVTSLVLLALLLAGGKGNRLDARLRDLSGAGDEESDEQQDAVTEFARSALPKVGKALIPEKEAERTRLQARLVHAGMYSRQAMALFLGVKVALMVGPAVLGLMVGLLEQVPLAAGLAVGCLIGAFGMVGPSFWLDTRKAARQKEIRRALPDAMDVLVICLEGGTSLTAAINRVAGELRSAHPLLAAELNLVQREVQLGRTAGEAFRQLAGRFDLEELRSLATVVLQSEKYGASLAKSFRVHAEGLRTRRILQAEEMAQKSVVMLLIPTVLFILPALFLAILGPIAIMMIRVLRNTTI